jgi:alpha-1,2-mannosyltransferase
MAALLQTYLIAAAAIFGISAAIGLTGALPIGILIAAVSAAIAAFLIKKYSILVLEKDACSRGVKIVSGIATVVALVQLARLAVFIIFPAQFGYSYIPSSDWEVRHSCFTAYYFAAQKAQEVPDIYNNALYSLPNDDPKLPRKPQMMGPFRVDVFEYPPPFLLAPRAVTAAAPDFFKARMVWFALNGALVLIAMIIVARFLGRTAGTRALLLAPLVWCALPFIGTLQKGNIQLTIIAMSMIAMVFFAIKRFISGGAFLAYAIASKLYPGVLVVYLIARRQWRAVIWTAMIGLVIAALTVVLFGLQPYIAFLHHLPAIFGGEAFPAFRNPSAMAINFSVPGIIFKLKLFGIPNMDFAASKLIGWIYTLLVMTLLFVVAQKSVQNKNDHPLVWMSVLILATLRSPFLPQAYAGFPPLWLLTIIGATHPATSRTLALLLAAWLGLNVMIPMDAGFSPRVLALISTIPQGITIALPFIALKQWQRLAALQSNIIPAANLDTSSAIRS